MFGCYGLYLAPSPLFCAGALFKDVHQIFVMLFASHCRLINGQSARGVLYSCAYPDPITHLCKESAFWSRESNAWPLQSGCNFDAGLHLRAAESDALLLIVIVYRWRGSYTARTQAWLWFLCRDLCFLVVFLAISSISLSGKHAVWNICKPPSPPPPPPSHPHAFFFPSIFFAAIFIICRLPFSGPG